MTSSTRAAAHAGSWYSDDTESLAETVDELMAGAGAETASDLCAVIVPHAGLRYSGPTAGQAYGRICADDFDRIFVLGPSHHVSLEAACGLSSARRCETPLGELRVDHKLVKELMSLNASSPALFEALSLQVDEAEHSIEMQFPFLARLFAKRLAAVRVVPLMIGSLPPAEHARLADVLRPFFGAPRTLFVISSDFCHYGARFSFRPSNCSHWQQIEALDRRGMALIEALDAPGFAEYLQRTRNTICGRHPISVLLHLTDKAAHECQFVFYDQSSKVMSRDDSSVSYAAALVKKSN
jgi:AmmeMemoRadiSam system protein B